MQKAYFHHITNYVSQQHWQVGLGNVKPSAYLDVEMSETQLNLLNPSYKDVVRGFLTYSAKGKGALSKIAKRKIDMIDGNPSSWAKLLNDGKRLKQIKDHNDMIAAVAEVTADVERRREVNKEKKEAKLHRGMRRRDKPRRKRQRRRRR